MKIKIIKECNFPLDSIHDLGEERNERAVRIGLAKFVRDSFEDSDDGTKGIVTRKTPEQADKEIKKANKKK
jgi:hypothetical protein